MTSEIATPKHINEMTPYLAGRPITAVAREFGLTEDAIVKLASNENPLGMAPKARAAIGNYVGDLARYPDPDGHELKSALAQQHGVDNAWIALGNGSSEILEMAGRAFLDSHSNALVAQYSFVVYRSATRLTGAEIITVPAKDYGHDLPAMAAAINAETRLIFVANPNNPTGTYFNYAEFEGFLSAVDGRAVVVLDEAYGEYLDEDERFDKTELVKKYPNLIIASTFSKAFGLAGLRIGYALAQPALIDFINRVRPAFNVSALAQVAALASLSDREFLERSRRLNAEGMAFLTKHFDEIGLNYVPSKGNFILVKIPNAGEVNKALLKKGVIVRPVANYGLPGHLRVSIGLPDENAKFIEALRAVLREA